jgi:hypothetical protein
MIYSPLSFFTRSADKKLATGAMLTAVGQAMVHGIENGQQVVSVSAGAVGEKFAGFSIAQTSAVPVAPANHVKVETAVVPGSGIVTVAKNPLAGTVLAVRTDTGAVVAVVSVTGAAVDLAVASAGLTVRLMYRYALTVAEARSLVGDVQPGGYSGNTFGQVGVAQEGVIYTDQFDTSVNFATATSLKLDTGGLVSDQTGTGVIINAIVKSVPTADYPFLGIEFDAL